MKDNLQQAARELVAGYKASGLSMPDIAALLVFGLQAVAQDKDTSDATLCLLAEVGAPFSGRSP